MSQKMWYYVTIERVQQFNVTVQADDEVEAADVALDSPYTENVPDEQWAEVVNVEEVKRFVE